jgi:hypothetical protein
MKFILELWVLQALGTSEIIIVAMLLGKEVPINVEAHLPVVAPAIIVAMLLGKEVPIAPISVL